MKFTLSWIREFVEIAESPAGIARRLTSAGLVVETVEELADGDAVLDIEIFSNRPDCMNVYGVAREVAAATGRPLAPYPAQVTEAAGAPAAALARVVIDDADLCGRYTARVMEGVRVGASPDWLARRLISVGLRPVNNVVDATNYVLWELGQPLHAFDADTIRGREIRVRRARAGESIVTLDGLRRDLEPGMLVIADAERPIALAGVMGGAATMVSERTGRLLLESAHFDPVSVRRTSKKMGLVTDASYRFERGADIEAAALALDRVAGLIRRTAGGDVSPGVLEARTRPPAVRRLGLRAARVSLLLGAPVDPRAMAARLESLGFGVAPAPEGLEVAVPSHRQDIEREVDLVEEVGRSLGYDSVPERLPHIPGAGGVHRQLARREESIRRALAAAAVSEAMTVSFAAAPIDDGLRSPAGPGEPPIEPVALSNPVAAGQEILRTTLLAGLLESVARNLNRGSRAVRLFEIGRTFRKDAGPDGPVDERLTLGLVLAGEARPRSWMEPPRMASLYDMKGVIESVLAESGLTALFGPLPAPGALAPGQAAAVLCADGAGAAQPVGRLGLLAPAWRERLDLRQEVLVAEIDLSRLDRLPAKVIRAGTLPRHPAVTRDLSLVVGREHRYGDLEQAIRGVSERIASVTLFDRYDGEGLPPGTIGLSLTIVYQHPERTMSSDEVTRLQEGVLETLAGRFGVRLRES